MGNTISILYKVTSSDSSAGVLRHAAEEVFKELTWIKKALGLPLAAALAIDPAPLFSSMRIAQTGHVTRKGCRHYGVTADSQP